eukprot:TRINITY_DN757_c0_g1_i1.p1 TRINITY_DN757_c0_g1~~TRINITY_DN757_c0_g1_i1.p1  ORF type:complete len:194 (+),score=41.35 TRINITY_DN757_c0_g1_i1:70-651(+)
MLEVQAPVDIAALPSVTEEATEFLSRQVSTLLSSRPGAGTSRVPLTLAELCVQTLVSSFAETPRDFINSPLPDKFKLRIAQRLPVELDLALAARYVTAPGEASERYWQRRTQHAAFACAADTSRHGHSWRRTFFEQKIRDELERVRPTACPCASLPGCVAAGIAVMAQLRQHSGCAAVEFADDIVAAGCACVW